MTAEEARNVFNAVGRAGAAVAMLGEAAQADAAGELEDGDLIAVVDEYIAATQALEESRRTRGLL